MSVDTATPDTAEVSTDSPTPASPIKALTEQYAKIAAFEGGVKDYAARVRANLTTELLRAHADIGLKSTEARGEDGPLVSFSVVEPKDDIKVTDPEALADYVMEHHPTEVVTEVTIRTDNPALIDYVTEHFPDDIDIVTSVRPSFLGPLLKGLKHSTSGVFDTDGNEVPGVAHIPAGDAKSITTSWKPGGKEAALAAAIADPDILALNAGGGQ